MPEKFKRHTLEGDRSKELNDYLSVPERIYGSEAEHVQKIRTIVEGIDGKVLGDIFTEELQKCGLDSSVINFIPLDKIEVVDAIEFPHIPENTDFTVMFGVTETDETKHQIYLVVSDETIPELSNILWTIIHEETHAVSARVNDIGSGPFFYSGVGKAESHAEEQGTYVREHRYANEGITEIITRRIFNEYCHRTGTLSIEERESGMHGSSDSYKNYTRILRFYAGIIEMFSGVQSGTGEDALLRSYMRNGTILPTEVRVALNERAVGLDKKIEHLFSDEAITESNYFGDFVRNIVNAADWTPEEVERFKSLERDVNNGQSSIALSELLAQFRKKA